MYPLKDWAFYIFIETRNVEELHNECGIDIMQIKDIIVQVSINK